MASQPASHRSVLIAALAVSMPTAIRGQDEPPAQKVTDIVEAAPERARKAQLSLPPKDRQAVTLALEWLKKHQDADGKWSASKFMLHDPPTNRTNGAGDPTRDLRVTALALLALLSNGSTMRAGPYPTQVKRAVIWIRQQMNESGLLRVSAQHPWLVDHAIATYALSEACQIAGYQTGNSGALLSRHRMLKRCVRRSATFLQKAQNSDHGWGQLPSNEASDPIATAWALHALRSVRLTGVDVRKTVLANARRFVEAQTDTKRGTYGDDWRRRHKSIEGDAREAHENRATAAQLVAYNALGIWARQALNQSPRQHPVLYSLADWTLMRAPRPEQATGLSNHDLYFGTRAMYIAAGRHWRGWQKHLSSTLRSSQRTKGSYAGSWNAMDWLPRGGRVEATALAAMTLSMAHRYCVLLRQEAVWK